MHDHHSHDHRDAAANFGPTFAIATALNLGLVAVQVFYGVVARLPARMKWTPKCFIVGKWALWARSAHPNAGLSTAKSAALFWLLSLAHMVLNTPPSSRLKKLSTYLIRLKSLEP